ncbi:MAG: endonuclease III, partial [Planctomycetes bacterium]|nr:endonuclease III [Planctomycetota bacterium]
TLNHADAFQLLVSTILSAQCTDARVNAVTPKLFKRYKTVSDFASADQEELEEAIRATGFFRNKAKHIRGAATKIVTDFHSKVPRSMDELLSLPGVARKTANVVLSDAFGLNEGIVVDTHVSRIAGRLRLTKHKKARADRIEQDLCAIVPRADWGLFSHLLILHGRSLCTARKPNCADCPLARLCPSASKV